MKCLHFAIAACIAVSLAMVLQAEQGGARTGGAAPGTTNAPLVGGTLTPAKPDARGWGWQVKALINPATPRPFYNKAKELLFSDKQVTSFTIRTLSAARPSYRGRTWKPTPFAAGANAGSCARV